MGDERRGEKVERRGDATVQPSIEGFPFVSLLGVQAGPNLLISRRSSRSEWIQLTKLKRSKAGTQIRTSGHQGFAGDRYGQAVTARRS